MVADGPEQGTFPMARSKLLVPPSRSSNGLVHRITPESAGWTYVGFESRVVGKDAPAALNTENREICIVVLNGRARVTTAEFDSGLIGERPTFFPACPGPYTRRRARMS